jgi:NitT/TauT family transport system ATP-binding protein
MPATAIEIDNVGMTYLDSETGLEFQALKDVSLTVRDGEFITIIGPSGCGKTTLLKMIDGLIPLKTGSIRVHGAAVEGSGPERAVVFQNFALLPWLTVRENVAFGLRMRRVGEAERLRVADRHIELVGLEGFGDYFPRQLSGGMQQRVGLARALSVDPKVLLMDEPFGSVDAQTRALLQSDLLDIWEASRKTVVFVTHDMEEAVLLSDRVVIMGTRPGHIVEVVDIPLERPRTDKTRADQQAAQLTAYIWDVLRQLITKSPSGAAGPRR